MLASRSRCSSELDDDEGRVEPDARCVWTVERAHCSSWAVLNTGMCRAGAGGRTVDGGGG
jgi:hypothetical protein